MKGFIYYLSQKEHENIFYIGSSFSPNERKMAHRNGVKAGDSPLYKYMNKYIYKFDLYIIEEIEVATKKELVEVEIYWINQFKAWGFNIKNSVLYKNISENKNNQPFPIRLGDLKPILQKEAFSLNKSLHGLIYKILQEYISDRNLHKNKVRQKS